MLYLDGENDDTVLEEARAGLQEAVELVLEPNCALLEESIRNQTVLRENLVLPSA